MVRSPPLVTGISPKEGPPGTKVTIRGENLGNDKRDIIGLKICGVDCLMSAMWVSSKRITARTALAKGKGDIILTTKSGGVGSSTVQFKGYNIQIGLLQESAIWIDEAHLIKATTDKDNNSSAADQDYTDPLGLSDKGTDKKLLEEELQKLIPDGSGNTSLENFDPTWYLVENHQKTSFEDLKQGLKNLRHKLDHFDSGPFTFAKNNLPTLFECLNTLHEVHKKIEADEKLNGNICTHQLEELLSNSNKTSEAIFKEVLGRKERADITQNGLAVLNRYKLLFYLPSTMKKNIEKGDYDLVITDYMRTNSLTWLKAVPAFAKVFEEIEGRVSEFKVMLHEKLLQLPSTLEQQKRFIRYITLLDSDSDAAWQCINNYHIWTRKLMLHCQNDYIKKENMEDMSDAMLSPLRTNVNLTTKPNHHQILNKNTKIPARVEFVEEISKIILMHLPHLFKLGSSYLDGKLERKSNRPDEKKKEDFKTLIFKIINMYSNLIRQAFLPESFSNQSEAKDHAHEWPIRSHNDKLISWLPVCVKHVRSCKNQLQSLDLAPESIKSLDKLDGLLRSNCVDCVLNQAIEDVKKLDKKEVWILNNNEAHGCTTLLPTLFEGIVNDAVRSLKDVVGDESQAKRLFGDGSKNKVKTYNICKSLLQAFAITLHGLAYSNEKNKDSSMNNNDSNYNRRLSKGKGKELEPLPKDKKLLIILNNSSLTSRLLIPRLLDTFHNHHYPIQQQDSPDILKDYDKLYEDVFKQYISHKVDVIVALLEHNMNLTCAQWQDCPVPKGVGYWVKKCLFSFVAIHAEVYSIGPVFLHKVMNNVVETTAEEVSRVLQCVHAFSHNAALQAHLDIEAFDLSIGTFKTSNSKKYFRDANKVIPSLNKEQFVVKDAMLETFKSQMFFYLQCFSSQTQKRLL